MERKITIEEKVLYKEDYQMRMLETNRMDGLLPVMGRGVNGSSYYDYDVSGKVSMDAMFERSKISLKDIKKFLLGLKDTMRDVESHLLNKHCILLRPEYIFYENEEYYFCYFPLCKENFWNEFHTLTEYIVKHADYEDKTCVRMVFLLHKETMEEYYSLDKLIEECLQMEEEAEVPQVVYDTSDHDWIARQEYGSSILRETDNMWVPVKRFLAKHKKPEWGDWDGLYVEEEKLDTLF